MAMRKIFFIFFVASLVAVACRAGATEVPKQIKIGTLYASSGTFAPLSMPVHYGLKLWVDRMNAEGGVYIKAYGKRIPIKLISYDDQSNTATAASLYDQLITQDKVNILIADAGSVLTSVALPIAREHKMLLIDPIGIGAPFFTPDSPYIVLIGGPVSTIWCKNIHEFITDEGPKLGIKRVAILYSTNDFTGTQANTIRKAIEKSRTGIKVVYDQGVPTSTTSYTVIINGIKAAKPDAVIELGYPINDISFLRNLRESGVKFKWLFTSYPGMETEHFEKTVGVKGLYYVYTDMPASIMNYKAAFGMSLPEFHAAWNKQYPGGKVGFDFNSVVGYTTGLVLEKALGSAASMDQLAVRQAIVGLSGKLKTLDGTFAVDPKTGAQIGETMPIGQILPSGKDGIKLIVVYPKQLATGKLVYPAP
ncbi:MAG: amino acid ABC transporter substrate-binding protein [Deltaproteobacteria bacterium]|jgi:branched-chain amino acid transport system substrate-binding protein|nr:amino acid ABC transporter substrate-binding protein [Deltaproteobacteria bacterium]